MHHRLLPSILLVCLAACSELSTPADLDREQVLAIRATPPVLEAGESLSLELLAAGPSGPLAAEAQWQLIDAPEGAELGSRNGAITLSLDPESTPEQELLLEARLPLEDDSELIAHKLIPVGPSSERNPEIQRLLVHGNEVEELTQLEGESIPLEVECDELDRVAWYTTMGEIRYYRDARTELVLDEDSPDEGWLAVVVRDAGFGVSWRTLQLARSP